jgi:GDP-L-fucose synthase
MQNKILVAGAGGFIGGHLVAEHLGKGQANIRAVDIKLLSEWYQRFRHVETAF